MSGLIRRFSGADRKKAAAVEAAAEQQRVDEAARNQQEAMQRAVEARERMESEGKVVAAKAEADVRRKAKAEAEAGQRLVALEKEKELARKTKLEMEAAARRKAAEQANVSVAPTTHSPSYNAQQAWLTKVRCAASGPAEPLIGGLAQSATYSRVFVPRAGTAAGSARG